MADQEKFLRFSDVFGLQSVNQRLINQLVLQLEKDLNTPIDSISPPLLLEQVEQAVEESRKKGNLESLLYKIDIGEAAGAEALAHEKPVAALARLILKREAQKVIFRNQYGKG